MGERISSERHNYEIRLRGHLDKRWGDSFPGLTFTHHVDADGTPLTILRGPVADEAALHGLLTRIRDLGIPLLLVRQLSGGVEEAGEDARDAGRQG